MQERPRAPGRIARAVADIIVGRSLSPTARSFSEPQTTDEHDSYQSASSSSRFAYPLHILSPLTLASRAVYLRLFTRATRGGIWSEERSHRSAGLLALPQRAPLHNGSCSVTRLATSQRRRACRLFELREALHDSLVLLR